MTEPPETGPAPRAASTRYHHGDLRAALVERATDVVATDGVDALSLRELARDLGVSHAAPSRHFADKQALLDAVVVNGFHRLGAALADSVSAAMTGSDFTEQLRQHALCYVRFAVRHPDLLTLMFAAKHRQQAPEAILQAADQAFAVPLRLITSAQQRGEVIARPIEEIGTAIHATMHGFASLTAGGLLEEPDWEQALTGTMSLLVDGLRPR